MGEHTNGGRGRFERMEALLEKLDNRFDELDRAMVRASTQMEERDRVAAASLAELRERMGRFEEFRNRTEGRNPDQLISEFRQMQSDHKRYDHLISSLTFRVKLLWGISGVLAATLGWRIGAVLNLF